MKNKIVIGSDFGDEYLLNSEFDQNFIDGMGAWCQWYNLLAPNL